VPELALSLAEPYPGGNAAELEALVRAHFDFVWRLLRRLGLPESDADDAAQQVFTIAFRRFDSIQRGSERSFLYGCALNGAARWRSARSRSRERESADLDADGTESEGPSSDELLDRQKARQVLDAILDAMPEDLRTVFVLFEFEELTTNEIAELLDIPRGTVSSRLRRAREDFEKRVNRLESRLRFNGGRR
jgi:RNA polymerase sigma-70 factor, ECF subfamily